MARKDPKVSEYRVSKSAITIGAQSLEEVMRRYRKATEDAGVNYHNRDLEIRVSFSGDDIIIQQRYSEFRASLIMNN